jgi:hypothetical protein
VEFDAFFDGFHSDTFVRGRLQSKVRIFQGQRRTSTWLPWIDRTSGEGDITTRAERIRRGLDDLFRKPVLVTIQGCRVLIQVRPGSWICDNKAIAILLSCYGSGSPFREPWRPWSLVTLADRFFCQGEAQFTVREIRHSALKFFNLIDRIKKDYLQFRDNPVALLGLMRERLTALAAATPSQRAEALVFNLKLLVSGECAEDAQRKLPGVINAYRVRVAVSTQPLNKPKVSSGPDHLSGEETKAIIALAIGCSGHKYKAGPMVAGDRAEDRSLWSGCNHSFAKWLFSISDRTVDLQMYQGFAVGYMLLRRAAGGGRRQISYSSAICVACSSLVYASGAR